MFQGVRKEEDLEIKKKSKDLNLTEHIEVSSTWLDVIQLKINFHGWRSGCTW